MGLARRYRLALLVAGFILIIGSIGSHAGFIRFLNGWPAVGILFSWYVVEGIFLFLLGKTVIKKQIAHSHIGAVLVITFALNIISYWPHSDWVNVATGQTSSSILVASEDGVTFLFWQYIDGSTCFLGCGQVSAVLTYVATPLLLFLAAIKLFGLRVLPKIVTSTFEQA